MLGELGPWLADALVVLGVTVMTIGVYGVIQMPDLYTQMHAASKSVVVGVVSLCIASFVTGDAGIISRVFLIAIVLLLTTPVASHVIARGAYLEGQRMETPGAVNESDHDLTGGAR
jgi:multicomponent Na+:H+ antiporter subunit G